MMNKKLLLILPVMLLALAGCERKWPMNGALDGQWQLLTVENRENGTIVNRKEEQLFYRFQLQLLMLTDLGGNGYGTYIGRMTYDQKAQTLETWEMNVRNNSGDSGVPATPEQLAPFGMTSGQTQFRVVEADRKRLVLESEERRLTFRKF